MQSDPLRTSLCDQVGIELPIFGFAHSVAASAAISREGGLGVYGATRDTPDEITERLRQLRTLAGDRPIGVDLVLPHGMPEHDDREAIEAQLGNEHRAFVSGIYERFKVPPASGPGMRSRFVRSNEMAAAQIRAVLDSDVDVFACGIGAPPAAVAEARARGKKTVALVGAPHHARMALRSGVDLLVAQGYDAGAHTGQIGTFSLVPQIVDIAGSVPVLAAGGVATGRHVAASLALGAVGVWLGTAWLATREHAVKPSILAKLLAAGSADAVISRADSGKTLRQVRSGWSDAWAAPNAPTPLAMPYQDILVGDLLGAIDEHDVIELTHSPCGQSIAYFNELTTVADVMAGLASEARARLTALGG
jgi:NAD(P)H-dependent flavin oxidoreductase YrpB (nitropropane dioxygenase family)